jgi:hypothetical protein
MSLRIELAIAAVQAMLEKKQQPRNQILGAQERLNAEDSDWSVVVITREHDEEWELYLVWPDGDKDAPASKYDDVECGMVIRYRSNALSHADALLSALGLATGITE